MTKWSKGEMFDGVHLWIDGHIEIINFKQKCNVGFINSNIIQTNFKLLY